MAVLLRSLVSSSPGRTQLCPDNQRGRDPAYVGGGQRRRHGDEAVLLRSALHPVEQGKTLLCVMHPDLNPAYDRDPRIAKLDKYVNIEEA